MKGNLLLFSNFHFSYFWCDLWKVPWVGKQSYWEIDKKWKKSDFHQNFAGYIMYKVVGIKHNMKIHWNRYQQFCANIFYFWKLLYLNFELDLLQNRIFKIKNAAMVSTWIYNVLVDTNYHLTITTMIEKLDIKYRQMPIWQKRVRYVQWFSQKFSWAIQIFHSLVGFIKLIPLELPT